MSQPSERDEAVVRWIAAYLDVELMPWQEVVLQRILAAHRETPDVPPAVAAVCGRRFPPAGSITCGKPAGHEGDHDSQPGSSHGFAWK